MSIQARTEDPFVAFFYELLRDVDTVGNIQRIIQDQACDDGVWLLTDPDLAAIALRMVRELREQRCVDPTSGAERRRFIPLSELNREEEEED